MKPDEIKQKLIEAARANAPEGLFDGVYDVAPCLSELAGSFAVGARHDVEWREGALVRALITKEVLPNVARTESHNACVAMATKFDELNAA